VMKAQNPHLSRPTAVWGCEASEARGAVLAVHGRGQTPEFMREQSARIGASQLRFYGPSADGDTWYPNLFLEPLAANEPALANALAAVSATLTAIRTDGFTDNRIVLWGFSQGACLLSQFLLAEPASYAAAILCTGGYLGPDRRTPAEVAETLGGVPVLMHSIDNDPWVPPHRVEETAHALQALGAAVTLTIEPGSEHGITDKAMSDITILLTHTPSR
jgi:phospholipase/carboxylesterase